MFPGAIEKFKIILGSSSPRRKELLSSFAIPFEIHKPTFEEKLLKGELPDDYVKRNGEGKALSIEDSIKEELTDNYIIISADTIVVLDDKILEKPLDHDHAKEMLGRLSNQTHTVYTGIFMRARLAGSDQPINRQLTVKTEVTFNPLTDEEIEHYISTGEPLDKAGGYAIQGIGGYMVKKIDGSFSNVIGLPLAETREMIIEVISLPCS